jgi:outer membrane protein OmpA-like peptidoglycan-associated protein
MPGMKRTLLGIFLSLALAGCGPTGKHPLPAESRTPGSPTFAIFPVADYSYIQDVEQAYWRQAVTQMRVRASFANRVQTLPQGKVDRALKDGGYIKTLSYEKDIEPAGDTTSLEDMLNEEWSGMMKSQIVDLIKSERKRSIPGIANQDNHLDAPETKLLDRQAVINLGQQLGTDYIVRGRMLKYDLRQEFETQPLRRHILPFLWGGKTLREIGVAKATRYDPLDNMAVGGALADLGEKGDYGVKLQLWVQDASSGEVIWTERANEPIGSTFGGNDFKEAIGQAATILTRDFLTAMAVDSDGDGVWDHRDRCPETPTGLAVNATGCPKDSDGDGVPDYLDKCPGTPAGAPVDKNGCALDSDGDGVADYLDACPETPKNLQVNHLGCPKDSDGDGVADYLDKCPKTAAGSPVDSEGCPTKSEGDEVADTTNAGPNTSEAVAVDSYTEPTEGKAPVKLEVRFDFNKAEIKPEYFQELEKVAKYLKAYPETTVVIRGYTDSKGSDAYNLKLSQRRAQNVKKYLATRFGIAPDRLITQGFGENQPVASNATPEGRQKNRRSMAVILTTVTQTPTGQKSQE